VLKFGVFFFLSFPSDHSGSTVPPRAHLVALLAEVFISQTEGHILHKKKRRKRTRAIHVAVVKWHGQASFYVPAPSHSLQSHSQDSCRQEYLIFLILFLFFTYSMYQIIAKCPLLN